MKIVADEDITHVQAVFGHCGELILKPGRTLTRHDVHDADMLLIRSVTQVNQALLQDTKVKFVGSVVTGTDHLDIPWLTAAGIPWRSALGCNATAVVEYVVCTVAALQKQGLLQRSSLRAGVIGVGRIGRQVAEKLTLLGFEVVLCDPLRAANEKGFISTPLEAMTDLDFITLHTPLTHTGPYPTHHLIDGAFLQRQQSGCVLLNSGRGAVIDFAALKQYGQHLLWCLDVWENEPTIDLDVMQAACIATPHIAGHSVQSKFRAVDMIYQAAIAAHVIAPSPSVMITYPHQTLTLDQTTHDWRDVVLQLFDPLKTTATMRSLLLQSPTQFDYLRRHFPIRHEFSYSRILNKELLGEQIALLNSLGVECDS